MSDQTVMVKATPLLSVLAFMDERLPPASKESVLSAGAAAFPDEVQKIRKGLVLASDRYPVALLNLLIEKSAAELRQDPAATAHAIGRRGAEMASGGILRLALMMISIPNLLRKLEPVWKNLYSHGRTTNECREKSATVELHDFPYVSATQCARVTGMLEWFAQKAEKTARIRHTACRARRDPQCRWDVVW